mmetsp:Transcript_65112/g.108174  ORF Transcript_65112/g.108174 Transcript_65112/m.108174 type:complete len:295 (-) Transcript_65112:458-1342(-)
MSAAAIKEAVVNVLDLQDELLILCLERLPSLSLCRIASVCFAFTRPIVQSNGGSLSLPEWAARSVVERAKAEQSLRVYVKGDEPWRQVLFMFEAGLLERGVLHDLPLSYITRSGWHLAYRENYSHRTKDSDLERVPLNARYVLVGAVNNGGQRFCAGGKPHGSMPDRKSEQFNGHKTHKTLHFNLLAWGPRDQVLKSTHDETFGGNETTTDNEVEGVFFYRWPGNSFGFSSDPNLFLWLADCGIKRYPPERPEVRPNERLSWNLEMFSTGGWRAGRWTDLGQSGEWSKHMYFRL